MRKIFNCSICGKQIKKKDSVMTVDIICSRECKDIRSSTLPKKISILNVEYWLAKGLSQTEAESKISTLQKRRSPRCIEYWLDKGFNQEEAENQLHEYQKKNCQLSIEKYSYEDRVRKSKFCKEYWLERGYSLEYANSMISKYANNQTRQGYIDRFGKNDGNKKYEEMCNERKKNYSLDGYIKRHGKEKGTEKWNRKFKNRPNSQKATDFFTKLEESIEKDYKIYHAGSPYGEYGVNCVEEGKYYFFDFVIPDLKLCIEYHGDYWHCNPKKYDEFFENAQQSMTAKEIWQKDREKLECIKKYRGFDVHVIWESDDHEEKHAKFLEIINGIKASKNTK